MFSFKPRVSVAIYNVQNLIMVELAMGNRIVKSRNGLLKMTVELMLDAGIGWVPESDDELQYEEEAIRLAAEIFPDLVKV
jgi:hypothetical protein